MVTTGGGVTVNAPNIRAWEESNPRFFIYAIYTKNDPNVATLRLVLKDENNNVISQADIDVSAKNVGDSVAVNYALANADLGTVQVQPDNVVDDTVPADGSKQLTAPSDHYLIIEDVDQALYADELPTAWTTANLGVKGWIVYPGATITLTNQDTVDHAIRIYYVPATQLTPVTRNIEFVELDANGNELYNQGVTVDDTPAVQVIIPSAGTVEVQAVG